jgi:thiaminase/transcriptional activator TenA
MTFSQSLYEKVCEIFGETHEHRIVVGMGIGDLPILPCMWSYREISRMLAKNYPIASIPYQCGGWIKMYSSSEFGSLTTWLIDLLDRLTAGKPTRELASLEDHFLTTSRFEYMFWDMVYQGGE